MSTVEDGDLCRFVKVDGALCVEHHCSEYADGAVTDSRGKRVKIDN